MHLGPYALIPRVLIGRSKTDPEKRLYGSDRRQKGPVQGICYLCHEEHELQLSHIIPQWAYKWAKGEFSQGSRWLVKDDNGELAGTKIQDGFKAYMLCHDCEQWLSQSERLLEQFSTKQPQDLNRGQHRIEQLDRQTFYITEESRPLLARALYSIVLRMHWAPQSFVRITSRQLVERIRQSILHDSFQEISGPVADKWYQAPDSGINPRAYSGVSVDADQDDRCVATVTLGGITWYFGIGDGVSPVNKTSDGEPQPVNTMLDKGAWTIQLTSLRSSRIFFADTWDSREYPVQEEFQQLALMSPCPCGSGASLLSCCIGGWVRGFSLFPQLLNREQK